MNQKDDSMNERKKFLEHLSYLEQNFERFILNVVEKTRDMYQMPAFSVNRYPLIEAKRRIFRDLLRQVHEHSKFEGLSEPRIAAYFTFWIKRLRPFIPAQNINTQVSTTVDNQVRYMNEIIALVVGALVLHKYFKKKIKPITGNFLFELLYTLRFRAISPAALLMIYHSLIRD